MIPSLPSDNDIVLPSAVPLALPLQLSDERHPPLKTGRILDFEFGVFGLEYDNTQGKRNTMRLDALTYEKAIREAKSFLGIDEANHDEAGIPWEIE
jgi:hypothetical protein